MGAWAALSGFFGVLRARRYRRSKSCSADRDCAGELNASPDRTQGLLQIAAAALTPLVKIMAPRPARRRLPRRSEQASTRRAIAGAGSTKSTGQGGQRQGFCRSAGNGCRRARRGRSAVPSRLDETRRDLARDLGVVDAFAAHDALGDAASTASPTSVTSQSPRIAHQRLGVVARDRARVASTLISPSATPPPGLIAGTTPTKGSCGWRRAAAAAPASRRCCRRRRRCRARCSPGSHAPSPAYSLDRLSLTEPP